MNICSNDYKGGYALLSVVVPIYNSERYLAECIETIIKQTYHNLQLILIDDGSQDSSVKICKKFSGIDSRIKIIQQKHAGASAARINGIKNASGQYITFIDSDDWIDETAFEKMMVVMSSKHEIDICMCSYVKHQNMKKTAMCRIESDVFQELTCGKALEIMFEEKEFTWSLWGKIYKRELFFKDEFINTSWPSNYGDDTYVNWHIFKKARKVACLHLNLYHYRLNPDSLMHQKIDSGRLIYFDIYDNILREIGDMHGILARNIIRAMVKIGINVLYELTVCNKRDEDWNRAYITLKKYSNIYEEMLDEQQQMMHGIIGKTDDELDRIKNECLFELRNFCGGHKDVFVYGAGMYAKEVAEIMEKENLTFRAFVVTDMKKDVSKMNGHDVLEIEYVKKEFSDKKVGIVTGLSKRNLEQVTPMLEDMLNWDVFIGTRLNLRFI